MVRLVSGNYFNCLAVGIEQVKCWGYNHDGELGDGGTTNSGKPVSVEGLPEHIDFYRGRANKCMRHYSGGGRVVLG